MDVHMRTVGSLQIVHAAGPVTVDSHARLNQAFKTGLDVGRTTFVLNLTAARTIDSLSIGTLIACVKRAREQGGDLLLVLEHGGDVHDTIQITGLDRVFRIFGSEDEATAAAQIARP